MAAAPPSFLLSTQPGWDIATIAELRALGVPGRFPVYHRGSSVLVPALRRTSPSDLTTPASVYRVLLDAAAVGRKDALSVLLGALQSTALQELTIAALHGGQRRGLRRYSITTEVYGRTTVTRRQLAAAIEDGVKTAFPRWKRSPEAGARFLCKADPEYAALAVQITTNLATDQGLRAGSLREHLAAALLTLGRAAPGSAIFDPFMGTGTILKVAAKRFGVAHCFGLEVSSEAFQLARQRLSGARAALFNTGFEEFDSGSLPAASKLISNVPFGQQFTRTPTRPLIDLILRRPFDDSHLALLMSRDQAKEVAPATGLNARNVLVLGQPAAIVYGRRTAG